MRPAERVLWLICTALLLLTTESKADELRPALLVIRESSDDSFEVLWKHANIVDASAIQFVFPNACEPRFLSTTGRSEPPTIRNWQVDCPGGLDGYTIYVNGLQQASVDVLVRIERRDGSQQVTRLNATSTEITVQANPGIAGVAISYMDYGITHILGGFDHLLFVLALALLLDRRLPILYAVTSFTIAHSITLAIATLGIVAPAPTPIEAVIALSVLFLAVELERKRHGYSSITIRKPWIVAFMFGLLHGFGFAGALLETGLPQDHVISALLFFNLGVEVGQIGFVVAIIAVNIVVQRCFTRQEKSLRLVSHYAIGTLAAFWTIERVAAFW